MTFTDDEAKKILIEASKGTPKWMQTAREMSIEYKALVTGEGFKELLIKIEHLESESKATARKKYSKDIRDVIERVLKPRYNVFQANGGSEKILIDNDTIKKLFINKQSNFKSNKSIFKYLSEVYFHLYDTDPNGVLFLEYKNSTNLYPTYKATKDIRDYEPNGQKLEYIVFEPYVKDEHPNWKYWRIVDDKTDRTFVELGGGTFTLLGDYTFEHPFGETPGLILSEKELVGTKIRIPSIQNIIELAKDHARDKSILTIYKFQKGYPIHWRFVTQCRACTGLGKVKKAGTTAKNGVMDTCGSCNGHGYIKNTDVTDIVTIPIPDIDQPNIAPNIAGYVSPDLDTWKQYKEDIKDSEKLMKDTMWGTNLYSHENANVQETETATGRYIDVQPIINVLNDYADTIEYVDNTLCNWVLNFIDPVKNKGEILYSKSYGRRFILESADVILEKYQEAKKTSDSSTVLDKLLEEFILSKFKNDHVMQNIMLKKMQIEPFVHMTLEQINTMFGNVEVVRKELFNRFWSQCDVYKPKSELITEFETYYTANKAKITLPKVVEPTKK